MKTILWNSVSTCFTVILLATSFSVAAEQVLYVQSAKAKLMTAPNFNSKTILVLKKGASVSLVKEHGRWLQVNFQSDSGWIPKLLLDKQPPVDKVSIFKGKEKQLEKSARRRASTNATAAATRGLRSDDRARISDQGKPDYAELKKMEAVEISTEDLEKFQEKTTSP